MTHGQHRQVACGLHGMHSHLEQADTGLETRNRGLSEKLDRGIMSDQGLNVTVEVYCLYKYSGRTRIMRLWVESFVPPGRKTRAALTRLMMSQVCHSLGQNNGARPHAAEATGQGFGAGEMNQPEVGATCPMPSKKRDIS
jgi:hypothetical protein